MLKQKAKDYFKKYEDLRILFFFDQEQEYREEIDNWDSNNITLIEADNALFNLKYKLEYELADKKVFLYFPIVESVSHRVCRRLCERQTLW